MLVISVIQQLKQAESLCSEHGHTGFKSYILLKTYKATPDKFDDLCLSL